MSNDEKTEACNKFHDFELQAGPEGIIELMMCGTDYKVAHQKVKAFCRAGRAPVSGTETGPSADEKLMCDIVICNIAKAQVCLMCD